MPTINFPLTISEITKMRKDGDRVSLYFSYAALVSLALCLVFFSVYYFSSSNTFEAMSIVCLPLAAIFLLVVYFYRPYFLLSERRKFKEIDKVKGEAYEEAIERLTPDQQKHYLDNLPDKHKIK